jgi:hypothetical protein
LRIAETDEPKAIVDDPGQYTFEDWLSRKGPAGSSISDAKKVATWFLENEKVTVNELVTGSRTRSTVLHYLRVFKSEGYIQYHVAEELRYYDLTEEGRIFFSEFINT